MSIELNSVMSGLAAVRSVFHSEADLQHALAWQIQRVYPQARVRLEPRPRRGVRLDVLVTVDGHRTAIEVKYLLARFHGEVDGEVFDLPNQAAQDISRHDVVKDLVRVETLVADGYANQGAVLVLSNDPAYWRLGRSPETIDAAFRLHESRMLHGLLTWKPHAGAGTTRGRDLPLPVAGSYRCRWRDYFQATDADGRTRIWRYLLLTTAESITRAAASPVSGSAAIGSTTATRPGVVVPSSRGGGVPPRAMRSWPLLATCPTEAATARSRLNRSWRSCAGEVAGTARRRSVPTSPPACAATRRTITQPPSLTCVESAAERIG